MQICVRVKDVRKRKRKKKTSERRRKRCKKETENTLGMTEKDSVRFLQIKTKNMRVFLVSEPINRQLHPTYCRRQGEATQVQNKIIYVKLTVNPIWDSSNNIIDNKRNR